MSPAPHEPCIFRTVVSAREICGMARAVVAPAAVTAAPLRNLRREDAGAGFIVSVRMALLSLLTFRSPSWYGLYDQRGAFARCHPRCSMRANLRQNPDSVKLVPGVGTAGEAVRLDDAAACGLFLAGQLVSHLGPVYVTRRRDRNGDVDAP